ncbi:hypothetical protein BV25DRAFT_1795995 [Artomyces pyxidatus]|uniref:Uncharacterized protein n=1 Tax=Artomyces pyxidatus TaxID=48021 RepID=A0ACB8TEK5_9AGAM|nr:hypothetical protein BV25DRAFT_1795995 [Artomyces pyxidatus]
MERPSESRTSKQSRSIESAHPLLPGSPQSPRQAQTVDAITAELRNGEPDRRATVVAPERPQRPPLRAQDSSLVQSEYMNMLLALDAVPQLHNLLASFFTWILLAGFVVLPGTFSTLKQIQTTAGAASLVLHAVQHVSLFVIAYVCCAIGAGGMSWLWWRWRGNYIWLLNRIFLPGAMNGLAGVLSTIASVFGAQQGNFTASSITTMAVTGACTVICGGLTAFYTFFKLGAVKKRHEREIGREKAGKHGEGWLEEAKERAQQPEPERGVFR